MLTTQKRFADANADLDDADFVLFGVPFDLTCSFRPGSRMGPEAIRSASYNFETYLAEHDVDLMDLRMHDAGDMEETGSTSGMLAMVEENTRRIVSKGKFPMVIGGEHSLSPGAVKGMGVDDLGVISIDAHLDFRREYLGNPESHACSTRRMSELVGIERIIPIGVRSICREEKDDMDALGLSFFSSDDVRKRGIDAVLAEALDMLDSDRCYLTIDIDGIDPAYAPGVGTPEPFGLTPYDVKRTIQSLAPRLVGMDLVEVCPPYDNGNTSALAARLIREALAVVAKEGSLLH